MNVNCIEDALEWLDTRYKYFRKYLQFTPPFTINEALWHEFISHYLRIISTKKVRLKLIVRWIIMWAKWLCILARVLQVRVVRHQSEPPELSGTQLSIGGPRHHSGVPVRVRAPDRRHDHWARAPISSCTVLYIDLLTGRFVYRIDNIIMSSTIWTVNTDFVTCTRYFCNMLGQCKTTWSQYNIICADSIYSSSPNSLQILY